jgi:biopolymer transport protein ExbD
MSSRKSSADEDVGATIDLTPMLDVVFIMLIFFIVTATFIKEPGVEVDRPDANTAQVKNAKILVAINSENKVWVDKSEIDPLFVKDQIELLLAENPKSPVIIQADAKSSIKVLNEVAQAARQLGITDISIAVQKE